GVITSRTRAPVLPKRRHAHGRLGPPDSAGVQRGFRGRGEGRIVVGQRRSPEQRGKGGFECRASGGKTLRSSLGALVLGMVVVGLSVASAGSAGGDVIQVSDDPFSATFASVWTSRHEGCMTR